jgi:DNA-directed RNA polymerase subunit RPC12/RpoP
MSEYILWKVNFKYVCRDCGYEGNEILVSAIDKERTSVRCPKCGSHRVHVELNKVNI